MQISWNVVVVTNSVLAYSPDDGRLRRLRIFRSAGFFSSRFSLYMNVSDVYALLRFGSVSNRRGPLLPPE